MGAAHAVLGPVPRPAPQDPLALARVRPVARTQRVTPLACLAAGFDRRDAGRRGPLVAVAGHVVQPVVPGGEGAHVLGVVLVAVPAELLAGVGGAAVRRTLAVDRLVARRLVVPPGEQLAVRSARRLLPFPLAREALALPRAVLAGTVPVHRHRRLVGPDERLHDVLIAVDPDLARAILVALVELRIGDLELVDVVGRQDELALGLFLGRALVVADDGGAAGDAHHVFGRLDAGVVVDGEHGLGALGQGLHRGEEVARLGVVGEVEGDAGFEDRRVESGQGGAERFDRVDRFAEAEALPDFPLAAARSHVRGRGGLAGAVQRRAAEGEGLAGLHHRGPDPAQGGDRRIGLDRHLLGLDLGQLGVGVARPEVVGHHARGGRRPGLHRDIARLDLGGRRGNDHAGRGLLRWRRRGLGRVSAVLRGGGGDWLRAAGEEQQRGRAGASGLL